MFEPRPHRIAFRGCMIMVCLAALGGCVPEPPAGQLIETPTNLAATAGDAVVILTWTATSGAASYHVKRATTSGGPYAQVAAPISNSYADSAVTNGASYFYVVSAVNAANESLNSSQASATPVAASAPPAAPANLAATAGVAQVSLNWTASSTATNYRVKRATTSGGPYTQVAAPASTSYVDTMLVNDTTYYYVVSALNSAGESANSAQVVGVPFVSNPPPTTFGTWTNVTPAGVDLTNTLCSNYGTSSIQSDPAHPSNLYTHFHCQGIWKSTDYGLTWTGPINTGTNGALAGSCSGGIAISRRSTAIAPVIYMACIRGGSGAGLWKSVDGGVNWTSHVVTVTTRQDYYVAVDPYDSNHVVMTGHEFDSVVESTDGGATWSSVSLPSGMLQSARSPLIFFIDNGNASTTRRTWLWIGDQSGGLAGTWRTTSSGATWTRVDSNEHVGDSQIYQPDNNGAVFMAGAFSALGSGVLRSSDYGQTWTHVGMNSIQTVVFGTSKNVYSMYGYPVGPGGFANPSFEVAAQPGTGTWVAPGTPAGMTQGPAQISVVNDGTNNIFVGAMWNGGVWRYVEP